MPKQKRRVIRIFYADAMSYTPLAPGETALADALGCELRPTRCSFLSDLIVSRSLSQIRGYVGWRRGRHLVWTHEPRHDITGQSVVRQGRKDIHIMNLYTGDVYLDNYYYLRPALRQITGDLTGFPKHKDKLCCIVAGYGVRDQKLPPPAFDLTRIRCEWALRGNETGQCDVYGGHWPDGVSIKENRDGEWYNTKKDLLRPYRFSISPENTNSALYVTEKIWDSIENVCLPIYHGGRPSAIYQDFPEGSFVDLKDFSEPDELFSALEAMSEAEWTERMNTCLRVMRELCARYRETNTQQKAVDALAARIRRILGIPPVPSPDGTADERG